MTRVLVLLLTGLLAACAQLEWLGPEPEPEGGWPCSRYNESSRDGFRLYIEPGYLNLKVGRSAQLALNTTWLDIDLERQAVTCRPDWYISENQDSIRFDPITLTVTAVTPGTARLTGRANGASYAEDYVIISVSK